jgi:hypothetical protein
MGLSCGAISRRNKDKTLILSAQQFYVVHSCTELRLTQDHFILDGHSP